MTTTMLRELREATRRLQAQTGHLAYQLGQPTVDLALVVKLLGTIEDTAHETIQTFHDQARSAT